MTAYPSPWPLVPFTYQTPVLQKYIPLNLLPKTLVVHDPWNLLAVSGTPCTSCTSCRRCTYNWTDKPDVPLIYCLRISPHAERRLKAEAQEPAKEGANVTEKMGFNAVPPKGFLIFPEEETTGSIGPPVHVIYPPEPTPSPVEVAHLYLSPAHAAGEGNHSVVYNAEWEVPRSMVMAPLMCDVCVVEDVAKILKEEDREDGEKKSVQWKKKSAVLNKVDDNEMPDPAHSKLKNEGPVHSIHTRVPWRSPDDPYSTFCTHIQARAKNLPYPAATKVRVIAKLSLQYDDHLETKWRTIKNSQNIYSSTGMGITSSHPWITRRQSVQWYPSFTECMCRSGMRREGI